MTATDGRRVPAVTIARLPGYLRALDALSERGTATTSSAELAVIAGVHPPLLRRDLSHLGSHGVRGVGYDVEHLRDQVAAALGMTAEPAVVIVGVGHLGHALANHLARAERTERGFRVVALVDADPALVGREVAGLVVEPDATLADVVAREGVRLAVLAVPAAVAQDVTDRLVAAGVTGVLSLVPAVLSVPDGVDVRSVDLAGQLQILAFHERRKTR